MSAAPAAARAVPAGLTRFLTWLRYGPGIAAAGLAAARLGLLRDLAAGPRTGAELAAGHGLSERATRVVLESLLAARVLRRLAAGGFAMAREAPWLYEREPLHALLGRAGDDWEALGALDVPLRAGDVGAAPLATAAALLGVAPPPADLADHLRHPPRRWLLHALLDRALRHSTLAAARRLGVLEPLLTGEGDP
ncbi:MAG TPA: hypothetical protein VGO86_17035, partial [Candidatus Dormibacteraeota bacterium]